MFVVPPPTTSTPTTLPRPIINTHSHPAQPRWFRRRECLAGGVEKVLPIFQSGSRFGSRSVPGVAEAEGQGELEVDANAEPEVDIDVDAEAETKMVGGCRSGGS
jgi:hypothetical protein